MQIICWRSKLRQLSASSVIANSLLKYIQVFKNSITGKGYMGEVLIEVWLKSINK